MKRCISMPVWLAMLVIICGSSCRKGPSAGTGTGQPEPNVPAKADTGSAEPKQAADADPDKVLVTVNGQAITEGQLQEEVNKLAGRISPDVFEKNKESIRQQTLGILIGIQILEEKIKDANIVATEEDVLKQIEELAARQNLTVEELKEVLQKEGVDFEQWKKQMEFDRRARFEKLFELELADELKVTESDANNYYTANIKRYEVPERVRASHILIRPAPADPNADPNEANARALAKAQELLKEIKEDGADFEELAKANSDSQSKESGGDLGFQPKGAWVEPFEQAAFALEIGQISDIVRTQFGYHIIKVTGREDAHTRTFDQVKDQIMRVLLQKKQAEHIPGYIESLKAKAEIVYPTDK